MRFLVDANLPYLFSLWHNPEFQHVKDLNDELSDSEIWDYAKQHNLTIITKDSDFSNRIIASTPPPKVIHLKIGNMKMNQFHAFITNQWEQIESLSKNHKLVNVYIDKVMAIG